MLFGERDREASQKKLEAGEAELIFKREHLELFREGKSLGKAMDEGREPDLQLPCFLCHMEFGLL